MKEVTRIHIAKVSYDIEIAAKKKLESYVESVALYAEDENVLEDIEIRITELLDERNVKANGVIALEDVAAIREVLGEPSNFSGEGDIAIGPEPEVDTDAPKKKLFRDIDGAVVGGVLSGVAKYFGINALWVRLGFIVLLLATVGLLAVLYIIFWIAVPAAKSVAEKLQMEGEIVTLGTIRKYNEGHENGMSTKDRITARRKGFGIAIGVAGIISALGAAAITVAAGLAWHYALGRGYDYYSDWLFWLIIASGALLTVLAVIVARSGFIAKLTKPALVMAIAVIVAGLATFGTGAGVIGYQTWQNEDAIRQSIKEKAITLPVGFSDATSLTVNAKNAMGVMVDYRVSSDYKATLTGLPNASASLKLQDGKMTLDVKNTDESVTAYPYQTMIIIYGPALESVSASQATMQYTAKSQTLVVSILDGAQLSLYGNYEKVTANVNENGALNAEGASLKAAVIAMQSDSSAALGNIDSLEVTQPTACPNNSTAQAWAESIRTNTMKVNGEEVPTKTVEDSCGRIMVGPPDDDESWGYSY